MNSFGSLLDKPWLAAPAPVPVKRDTAVAAKTAVGFLIAVISVIFFLLILTLISRSQFEDFEALAGAPWQPLTNSGALWFNTFCLLLGSAFMQWSAWLAQHRTLRASIVALLIAAIFSWAFIFGQLAVWDKLVDLGFLVETNPANSYFYLLTGAHAVHLAGGFVALTYILVKIPNESYRNIVSTHIHLCARYWHFLLALWLLLFWLLTASAETFNTIAKLCGL